MANVELTVPVGAEWEATRDRIVRSAVRAAFFLFAADTRVERVRARILVAGITAQPVPAFYGEIVRAAFQGINPNQGTTEDLLSLFNTVQWYSLPIADTVNVNSSPMARDLNRP